jgi:hypothetical protein
VDTVIALIEEKRKKVKHLMEGALVHLGYYDYEVTVNQRPVANIFDPDEPLFTIKAEINTPFLEEDLIFIRKNLVNSNFRIKEEKLKDNRLILHV